MSLAAEIYDRALSTLPVGLTRRLDSWVSAVTGLGGLRDKTRTAMVAGFRTLTLQELDALYHGDDLPGKIVDALPEEAMRQGWKTGSPALDQALERWRAQQEFLDAWIWGRLYGRGAILIGTSDRLGAMDQPLDISKIGKGDLAFLLVVDGQDLTIADRFVHPGNKNFGDPRTYYVNTAGTTQIGADGQRAMLGRVAHASRLIMFGGARTSERQRLRNHGRDFSVLQKCQDVLRDVDQSWRSVMCLIQDLSQAVFKIDGLIELVADGKSNVIMDRMQVVDMARTVARAVVIDAENEAYEHTGAANVTGVDPLLLRVFTRLAAAADMPLTVLLGVSPAGLNATGESDIRIWYSKAEKAQRLITPQARRLTSIVAASEGIEFCGTVTWPALWTMTEKETAEIEKVQADTDAVRIQSQVMQPEEATLIRFGGADPLEVMDLARRQSALDPTGDIPDTGPEIEPGSIWTDTGDRLGVGVGHRLEVTARSGGRVLFMDLDSATPGRQRGWRESYFLTRARPPGPPVAPAPVLAAAPEPAPALPAETV